MEALSSDYVNPYAGRDVPWLLRAQVEQRANDVCLVWAPFDDEEKSWTYLELYNEAQRLAGGLAKRDIGVGDRVLIHMNNCPEFLVSWHACALLGAIAVTTNTRAHQREMDYFVDHSQVKVAITQPQFVDMLAEVGGSIQWVASTDQNSDGSTTKVNAEFIAFDDLRGFAEDLPQREADPLLPLSVQYTSGTTSRPKGVVWTHANVLWGGQVGAANNEIDCSDTNLVFTPLFHTNAISWGYFPTLWAGGKTVLQPKFSASNFWDVAIKHQCSWANVIPFAVQAVMAQPVPEKHMFKRWIVGAANVGEIPGLGSIEDYLKVGFVGAWGMTELITHGTYTPMHLASPPFSIGVSVLGYQIKVVGANNQIVGSGETGLLKVKAVPGVSLFLEYMNEPEKTAECFDSDGWFDTGDRVTLLPDGHMRFADRAKDMLKVGGENVAASEIEAIIKGVPGVIESAVVAKPDKMRGELPVAFVRAANPSDKFAEAILAACRGNLADFKVPVDVIFVDDFPRVELEKVAKNKLRERLVEQV